MPSDTKRTAQAWSDYTSSRSHSSPGLSWFEAGPEIHRHINSKITGSADLDWITYTVRKYFGNRLPLAHVLSLGCGDGWLERALARLDAFNQCDAYDVADGSIQLAKELANQEGLANIGYYVADINTLTLPSCLYDSVWIHSAMHHFQDLEHVCDQIRQALKPEGLLILNEYVGPSRFQFPQRQKKVANLALQLLPAKYRRRVQNSPALEIDRAPFKKGMRWFFSRLIDKLKDGDLIGVIRRRILAYRAKASGQRTEKAVITFPSARDVIASDPSESVRSEEILQVLSPNFEILEKKELGGNIIQFLLADIAGNFSNEGDRQSQILLRMLLNIEDTLLQCGEFSSDYVYLVARPSTK